MPESIERKSVLPERPEPIMKKGVQLRLEDSFIVFRSTIVLRGAPFVFWISDLSQPDALIPLPFSLPLYGDQISLLPLLMGVSMFVQQKMTTSQANPQQKMMTQFMSVFFIILFNQFPSGLNLYYTLFNVLTILQQKYLVQPKEIKTAP